MEWNADKYFETCGRVTEHGMKLVDVLRQMPCEKVLDLGCGTGVLTHEISEFVQEVTGIDSSSAMIEKARSSYPGLQFQVMDACALTWEDTFDAVFSNAVFHFIKEQGILLDSIHKALKADGALICEFGAMGNIAALLDAVETACTKRGKNYLLRFYYPAADEYRGLLEKHGFSVDSLVNHDLDTRLQEGEVSLRNWITQIFQIEMEWFDPAERTIILDEIESALRPTHWDGAQWHLPNRRIQLIARKGGCAAENAKQ